MWLGWDQCCGRLGTDNKIKCGGSSILSNTVHSNRICKKFVLERNIKTKISVKKMTTYLEACQTEFWKRVFEEEMKYLVTHLKGCNKILSVGCGPAIIERGLTENGFDVTGLDVSKEALNGAPDTIRTVVGNAENLEFSDSSFDAVVFVASLQFIKDYKLAISEGSRVLKPKGKIVLMLLNPESEHYKKWTKDSESYMTKIKHKNLTEIEKLVLEYFMIKTEYYLGISDEKVFSSSDPKQASLYIISGKKH